MKEIVGLLAFMVISGSTITLAVMKRTGNALTAILLLFALLSGWGIANYDWIRNLQWQVPGFDVFQEQVLTTKEDAVGDICREVEAQKVSIGLLLSNATRTHEDFLSKATQTQEDLGIQKDSLESLLIVIDDLEKSMRAQEQKAMELNDKAEKMQRQLIALHQASSELALLLTRVTWLQFEARDEYGVERAQAAVQKIMDELDVIVGLVLTDPKARKNFIAEVTQSLPPRQ